MQMNPPPPPKNDRSGFGQLVGQVVTDDGLVSLDLAGFFVLFVGLALMGFSGYLFFEALQLQRASHTSEQSGYRGNPWAPPLLSGALLVGWSAFVLWLSPFYDVLTAVIAAPRPFTPGIYVAASVLALAAMFHMAVATALLRRPGPPSPSVGLIGLSLATINLTASIATLITFYWSAR